MRRLMSAPLCALAAVALAGCGAGQEANTNVKGSAIAAVNHTEGTTQLLNARLVAGSGTGQVLLSISNNGEEPDALVAARTAWATGASVVDKSGTEAVVPLPAHAVTLLSADGPRVELSGLKASARTGSLVTVTFSFQKAGDISVTLPVERA